MATKAKSIAGKGIETLLRVKPENTSISRFFKASVVPTLKRHQYRIQSGYSITGEAPKQFLRVHEPLPKPRTIASQNRFNNNDHHLFKPRKGRKANVRTWPLYIAKTARKWYPTESVMEYALNRLGEAWGMRMAHSKLVWAGGQLRFLSRYFLSSHCLELVHGADILANHLNDEAFVKAIELEDRERELNSVQLFSEALRSVFPAHHQELLANFCRLLLFDALVGNNDRHFYNYGVVRDVTGRLPPYFSPIYDTARALLWNEPEAKLLALYRKPKELDSFLNRYAKNSRPKLGWEGEKNINHFDVVKLLLTTGFGLPAEEIRQFYQADKLTCLLRVLDTEFANLLSPERLALMKLCLQVRFNHITQLICSIP
jgi:hypothetical protein